MCSAVGALAYVLKQPMVLGFLIAGILIGPFGPFGLIKDTEMLNSFSDIAIVLLLFGVGLTFPLGQLRAIGRIGTGIAVIEVLVMLGIGFGVAAAFGWNLYDSMFLAAALSISSTAIIVKVLEDMGKIESTSAILMIGVLVIEDLVAILIISAMHSGVVSGSFEFTEILVTMGKIGLFIGGTIGAGVLLMPRIFALIAKLERYEITIMFALGTAFGLAFLSYQLGFSAATGAFLAGDGAAAITGQVTSAEEGAMEGVLRYTKGAPNYPVDLSEAHLFSAGLSITSSGTPGGAIAAGDRCEQRVRSWEGVFMYRELFVPVDNSQHSDWAVDRAIEMCRQTGGRITGNHVYAARLHDVRFRQLEVGLPAQFQEPAEIRRQRKIHDKLIEQGLILISDSFLDVLDKRGEQHDVTIERKLMEGIHYEQLAKDVNSGDYDLVVMGAHGIGQVKRSQLGSVTSRVARLITTDQGQRRVDPRSLTAAALPLGVGIFAMLATELFSYRDLGKTLKVNALWLLARCTDPGSYVVALTPPLPALPVPAALRVRRGLPRSP